MTICLISVLSDLRNLRRAGILKKRFLTEKLEPTGQLQGSCVSTFEPFMTTIIPVSLSSFRVLSSTIATAAIDARASPLNPFVVMAKRSCAVVIFDVACLSNDNLASVSDIPDPSSITWINVLPESLIITLIFSPPASTEFSISSFTTEDGLCITSPAAIWFATESGKSFITSGINQNIMVRYR